jgi:hypothetical protein
MVNVKSWLLSIVIGYGMKFLVQEIRKSVPGLWAKYVPELLRPYITTILGAVLAAFTGDPSDLVGDAIGGAIGGATGKAAHDKQKEVAATTDPYATEATDG